MSKSTAEIRQIFLDFFQTKGHQIMPSSSLVPHNDASLLFTNAGMNQFKDVFLGLDKRAYTRATTSQRCVRAGGKHNDLDNVGYTARHHTFFEMLGNFSFGDYFKYDAIHFAWELLTGREWFNLPKEKLWITVYTTDDEAYQIWANEIGVPTERIIRIGDRNNMAYTSDNFWQMGDTGPCGPCTEIFYDHGDHLWGGPPGSLEEDGDRYIEIWNIVFMQFNRQADGVMQALPKPSVDTGMGLERIAAVLQHVNSNYDIDLFQTLIVETAKLIGTHDLNNKSLRVIADHIRSCAFLVADGVTPSNESRGYVLRRIIRRAVRHGHLLGADETFFYKLVAPLISVMGNAAAELNNQQEKVEKILKAEEEQFARTLARGLTLLDEELTKLKTDTLDGLIAFRLYDTYGFPLDLTADVCRERGLKVDEAGFELAMAEQRHRAREASGFTVDYNCIVGVDYSTEFCGYQRQELAAKVIAIVVDELETTECSINDNAIIFLDKTPFYAESGGQVGDIGQLIMGDTLFEVTDTQKYGQAIGHIGRLERGSLRVHDKVSAGIDVAYRQRVRLNHSATHLLHAALHQVLGEHAMQKGSLVNDKNLRFDFAHPAALKPEQIRAIEDIVNQQIRQNVTIKTEVMSISDAKSKGAAMALFGEKYGEIVRVLSMGDFSIELCGGTHARYTGDIGLFRIISESGIAAGIRRIEAMTGENALQMFYQQSDLLHKIALVIKSDLVTLPEKIYQAAERTKSLEKQLQQLEIKQILQDSAQLIDKAVEIKGIKLLVKQLNVTDAKMLRTVLDGVRNRMKSGIIVLAAVDGVGKISIIVNVTKELTDRCNAGELVSMLAKRVGGKGGGRPDMAQAGGEDVSALPAALASVQEWVTSKW